jgi:ubiquinone/menaquinone biosynthesis C-methylase UbiE
MSMELHCVFHSIGFYLSQDKDLAMKKELEKEIEAYFTKRASTYSDLDEPKTIVGCVRAIGIIDHMEIMGIKESDRVIDIGCGTGRFLAPFSRAKGFGLDLTTNMLMKAKTYNVPLVRADAAYLPFKDGSFDIVHSTGLLGIIRSKEILEEAARITKKGGKTFTSFPVTTSVSGIVTLFFMKFGYNPSLLDYWYTKDEIREMCPDSVRINNIYRLGFEPPFQRIYKNIESAWLSRVFLFLERNLRDKPFFKYFGARFLVEGVKI